MHFKHFMMPPLTVTT